MNIEAFFSFPWEGVAAFAGLVVLIAINLPRVGVPVLAMVHRIIGVTAVRQDLHVLSNDFHSFKSDAEDFRGEMRQRQREHAALDAHPVAVARLNEHENRLNAIEDKRPEEV